MTTSLLLILLTPTYLNAYLPGSKVTFHSLERILSDRWAVIFAVMTISRLSTNLISNLVVNNVNNHLPTTLIPSAIPLPPSPITKEFQNKYPAPRVMPPPLPPPLLLPPTFASVNELERVPLATTLLFIDNKWVSHRHLINQGETYNNALLRVEIVPLKPPLHTALVAKNHMTISLTTVILNTTATPR